MKTEAMKWGKKIAPEPLAFGKLAQCQEATGVCFILYGESPYNMLGAADILSLGACGQQRSARFTQQQETTMRRTNKVLFDAEEQLSVPHS